MDNKIYLIRENILFLENRYKDTKLEFNYLSSSEKLLDYQKLYFENLLINKSLNELKILKLADDDISINDLKISNKLDE